MDVFPVNFTKPVRVDFFGDEIEDIRVFDPTSQRTLESITEVQISSIRQDESSEREGEVFRHVGGPVFWVLPEPENAIHGYPLAFHEANNPAATKANFSLS